MKEAFAAQDSPVKGGRELKGTIEQAAGGDATR